MQQSVIGPTNSMTGARIMWPRRQLAYRLLPLLLSLLLPFAARGGAMLRPSLRLPAALFAAYDGTLGPVFTVAEVERQLTRDPIYWSGRVVLVRAWAARDVIWQPPDSLVPQLALVDAERGRHVPALSLTWGDPDPVCAELRGMPLLGRLMPPPQSLRLGTTAVYRVQLRTPVSGVAGAASAVLLDADPGRN